MQNNPDKRKKKVNGKIKILSVMSDKGSFSFITGTHRYYCPGMFWEAEQKEKITAKNAKVVAENPKTEGVPPERKKEIDILGTRKEKMKGKGVVFAEGLVSNSPPQRRGWRQRHLHLLL